MKANELMIDDWVFIRMNHTTKDYKEGDFIPHRVIGALHPYRRNERWTVDIVTIESNENQEDFATPIPLTPEILEKNGCTRYGKVYANLQQWVLKDGDKRKSFVQDVRTGEGNITDCWINYVHEFQHALKLCKIEKEIEL